MQKDIVIFELDPITYIDKHIPLNFLKLQWYPNLINFKKHKSNHIRNKQAHIQHINEQTQNQTPHNKKNFLYNRKQGRLNQL